MDGSLNQNGRSRDLLPPSTPSNSAVVLFSGGQDSTTSLFWVLHHFEEVRALGFDYGQKHAVEVQQAEKIAQEAGVPYDMIDMEGTLEGSALTEHEKDVSAEHEKDEDLLLPSCLDAMRCF